MKFGSNWAWWWSVEDLTGSTCQAPTTIAPPHRHLIVPDLQEGENNDQYAC
jgi:hypothetical protein